MSRAWTAGVQLLGVLLASWVAVGCAGPGTPAGLPVEDDFSDCSAGWSTDTDPFVSLACTGGRYRVLIKNPLEPQNARIFYASGVEALSVEADATRFAGPKRVAANDALAYGVGCWTTQVHGYLFVISPAGDWGIEKVTSGTAPPTTIAESERAHDIPGLRRTNRVRGVCLGGGPKPTRLALYVNGKLIAAGTDRKGFDVFPGFGFFVGTTKARTDVRFDNLLVREPTAAETRHVTRAARRGYSAKPPVPSLCKEVGVRYSGKTAQGAEVCFTLTPDGKELLESAWSFVEASGCPDQASGSTKSGYPGDVDASGRFDNPDGLRATVSGATATGVFEDSTICPGKTFRFTARRAP